MGKKSEVSAEERREIFLKVLRKEESTAALARKHGVAEASIYRWHDQFLAGGLDGPPEVTLQMTRSVYVPIFLNIYSV